MNSAKKVVAYILIALVLTFTIIAILGIWGIVDIQDVMINVLYSLLILFAASAVLIFIFSIFLKDEQKG